MFEDLLEATAQACSTQDKWTVTDRACVHLERRGICTVPTGRLMSGNSWKIHMNSSPTVGAGLPGG